MTMTNDSNILELVQRARRTETRLMRLCDYMGIDPTNKVRCVLVGPKMVQLTALDVGIGECLRFAKEKGIFGVITLVYGTKPIGTLEVQE